MCCPLVRRQAAALSRHVLRVPHAPGSFPSSLLTGRPWPGYLDGATGNFTNILPLALPPPGPLQLEADCPGCSSGLQPAATAAPALPAAQPAQAAAAQPPAQPATQPLAASAAAQPARVSSSWEGSEPSEAGMLRTACMKCVQPSLVVVDINEEQRWQRLEGAPGCPRRWTLSCPQPSWHRALKLPAPRFVCPVQPAAAAGGLLWAALPLRLRMELEHVHR